MKNILRVLGLAVRCDDTVVVEAEGEDEELAVEQLIERMGLHIGNGKIRT